MPKSTKTGKEMVQTTKLDERERRAGDSLNTALQKNIILAAAPPYGGKTFSVVKLIQRGEKLGFNVVLLDRDAAVVETLREVRGNKPAPSNLEYFRVDNWDRIDDGVAYTIKNLKAGDWCVVEQMGFIWDLVQSEYSRRVYGGRSRHELAMRAVAEEMIAAADVSLNSSNATERAKAKSILQQQMGFGGINSDGWSLIKRMYNDDFSVKLRIGGEYNILFTTSLVPMSDRDKLDARLTAFHKSPNRPEGDRDFVHAVNTVMVLSTGRDGIHSWRTLLPGGTGKDRGRELMRDVSFEGVGLVSSYYKAHGLDLTPPKEG